MDDLHHPPPFLGVLVYLIINGNSMQERALKQAADQEAQFRGYVQTVAAAAAALPTSSPNSPTCATRASSATKSSDRQGQSSRLSVESFARFTPGG